VNRRRALATLAVLASAGAALPATAQAAPAAVSCTFVSVAFKYSAPVFVGASFTTSGTFSWYGLAECGSPASVSQLSGGGRWTSGPNGFSLAGSLALSSPSSCTMTISGSGTTPTVLAGTVSASCVQPAASGMHGHFAVTLAPNDGAGSFTSGQVNGAFAATR
jgi:hypothetical protein